MVKSCVEAEAVKAIMVDFHKLIVGCIYKKNPYPEKKFPKVSQQFIVVSGVLNNTSKVYQNLGMQIV